MQEFIDLQGASGATYRFRLRIDGTAHLPTAGNYVLVQEAASGLKVLSVGVATDLSQVRSPPRPRTGRKPTHLFTRLNISRAVRTSEHEDLVARYRTAQVLVEEV